MARITGARATDYEDKRLLILDRAAERFASLGYERASMRVIAEAAGVSKALLYHYYHDKEALLFDVLSSHLTALLAAVEAAAGEPDEPEARLRHLAVALFDAYRGAGPRHRLAVANLSALPPERQEELRDVQRRIVAIFAEAIGRTLPGGVDRERLLTPITMSMFGMLNWHFVWFDPNGPLSREEYARLAATLILDGTRHLAKARAPAEA